MIYQKECEICGAYFETPTKIRKYCDACRNHPEQKRKQINRGLHRIRELEPRQSYLETIVCEYCGRKKQIPPHLVKSLSIGDEKSWDGNIHYYCCEQHKKAAYIENGVCYWCKKPLKGIEQIRGRFNPKYDFCSYECELEYSKVHAKSLVHVCKNCGKEYLSKKEETSFCSRQCAQEARKRGWTSPYVDSKPAYVKCAYCGTTVEMTRSEYNTIDKKNYCCKNCKPKVDDDNYYIHTQTCIICNKLRQQKSIYPIKGDFKPYYVCSDECARKYKLIKQRKKQLENKLMNPVPPKPRSKNGISLCSTCKTSYKDCERMQSEFRIIPKGAKYNSHGRIVTCPKYRG